MAAASISAPSIPPAAQHPLRERNFRMLWAGSAISAVGDQFYLVALPWAVLQLTGSAVAVGTILMAVAIPRAMLMLFGGALTDRISARRILMSTASARTLLVTVIGFLLWWHWLQLWELYVLGFFFGVADAFAWPAATTLLPSLVKREQLVVANSVFQTTGQLTTIVAPAPAGLVIRALGTAWAFFIDAISFLFIIAALWRLPDPPKVESAAKPPVWRSILDGIAYVRRDVPLRSLMLVAAMLNFCISGPMGVGLPYLVKTKFGSAAAYGLVISAMAAGGLIGALLAGILKIKRRGLLLLGACAVISAGIASMGLLGHLWLIAAVLLLLGSSAGVANVHIAAWIQQRIDATVRGRVVSVLMLANFGLFPVSLAVAGLLIAWNLKLMFLIAGVSMLVITAFGASQKQVRAIE
ncbi:MAG TPA: MFS transporter [Candidatus Dormibacteraeota bacterium]|nr:MFS transporter [Candidatus Dormibacteraeota bacterium]